MQQANSVICWNRGGFIQRFQVKWKSGATTGESGWTDYYPNPESKSFDLDVFNIPEGSEVWIEVAAYLGSTKESSGKVSYKRGCGKAASYSVTGATLTFDIKLAPDDAVNKIACQNHGGFKMKFRVVWAAGASGYTEYYFNPSTKTIDLDSLNIPEGGEAWIDVQVLWGKGGTSPERVVYQRGAGKTAKYEVLGTTLNFTINRIG